MFERILAFSLPVRAAVQDVIGIAIGGRAAGLVFEGDPSGRRAGAENSRVL